MEMKTVLLAILLIGVIGLAWYLATHESDVLYDDED